MHAQRRLNAKLPIHPMKALTLTTSSDTIFPNLITFDGGLAGFGGGAGADTTGATGRRWDTGCSKAWACSGGILWKKNIRHSRHYP